MRPSRLRGDSRLPRHGPLYPWLGAPGWRAQSSPSYAGERSRVLPPSVQMQTSSLSGSRYERFELDFSPSCKTRQAHYTSRPSRAGASVSRWWTARSALPIAIFQERRGSPGHPDPDAVWIVTVEAVRRGVRSTRLPGRRAVLLGTSGSQGEWLPFQTDREDGLATIAWIRRQPWFGAKLGMFGQSYMGFVQWAVAADLPNEIGALALQITASAPVR